MKESTPEVIIYTDGACSGNPGPGGWGAVLYCGSSAKEIYGSEINTTNNKMELSAAINALKQLKKRCVVHIYTDSIYLRDGITDWVNKWQKNGWRTASKSPVKNAELWQELVALTALYEIRWHWVKAHNGNPGNEKADLLACRGRDEAMLKIVG
jgi:ribonuclease HI